MVEIYFVLHWAEKENDHLCQWHTETEWTWLVGFFFLIYLQIICPWYLFNADKWGKMFFCHYMKVWVVPVTSVHFGGVRGDFRLYTVWSQQLKRLVLYNTQSYGCRSSLRLWHLLQAVTCSLGIRVVTCFSLCCSLFSQNPPSDLLLGNTSGDLLLPLLLTFLPKPTKWEWGGGVAKGFKYLLKVSTSLRWIGVL